MKGKEKKNSSNFIYCLHFLRITLRFIRFELKKKEIAERKRSI